MTYLAYGINKFEMILNSIEGMTSFTSSAGNYMLNIN